VMGLGGSELYRTASYRFGRFTTDEVILILSAILTKQVESTQSWSH
jgi:hypothetical protein